VAVREEHPYSGVGRTLGSGYRAPQIRHWPKHRRLQSPFPYKLHEKSQGNALVLDFKTCRLVDFFFLFFHPTFL
jgi:hypothetical protein